MFVERGRLLGAGAQIGELAVVPHGFDEEGPSARLGVEAIRKLNAQRVFGAVGGDFILGAGARFRDLALRFEPGGLRVGAGLLRHGLVGLNAGVGDEGRFVSAAVGGAGRVFAVTDGRIVETDDQMGVEIGAFGGEEGVDPSGFADEGDVGFHAVGEGFKEGDVRRAREVPILGVSDDVVEDGFAGWQGDDGGVADARLQSPDLLFGRVFEPQNVGVLGGDHSGRDGEEGSREKNGKKARDAGERNERWTRKHGGLTAFLGERGEPALEAVCRDGFGAAFGVDG